MIPTRKSPGPAVLVRRSSANRALLLLLALAAAAPGLSAQRPDRRRRIWTGVFTPVKWRSIGPFRGGRSVAATG
jgi:hypothetical protein